MSEFTKVASKSWLRFVVWSLVALLWLPFIVGVLWWGLPRWAPDWVMEHSPWFGPAFEATFHEGDVDLFYLRLSDWEPGISVTLLELADDRQEKTRRQFALELLDICAPAPDIALGLLPLLNDPDPDISTLAVGVLWSHRHPDLLKPLIEGLSSSYSPVVSPQAAEILGNLDPPPPFALVSSRLLGHPRADVQMAGCIALQKSPDPQAVIALVERIGRYYGNRPFNTSGPKLDMAVYALAFNPQPAAVDAIDALTTDPDPSRRRSVAQVLRFLPSGTERHRTLAIRQATDPDPEVREFAVAVLGDYSDTNVIAVLQRACVDGGKPALRAIEALNIIAINWSNAAFPPLLIALKHDEEAIRTAAEQVLGSDDKPITGSSHRAAIIALLGDPDPRVRAGAARVVKRMTLTDEEKQIVESHRRAYAEP